jgi:D-alanyl-D-alanine carboxypeptidase (penicillin-binding protein 5/6)
MYTYSRRRESLSPLVLLIPLAMILALAGLQLLRRPPPLQITTTVQASVVLGQPAQPPLPVAGAALVAVSGLGTLGSNGQSAPRPIASVTKVMTARVVLKGHPLRPGESGPAITLTAADAARYLQMLVQDQSALPVAAGMQLTQLELLQGLLIPSANNFAEILAAWDAGSVEAFVAKMNAEARALGMSSTTYADPSGFSPRSVSTPQDLLLLERAVMQDPVFASIVNTPSVRLPGIGPVSNVNQILGQEGIVGIKTGFTEEAGGNLAFAARRRVGNREVEVLGAVLGQTDRPAAFEATRRLLASVGNGLQVVRVATAGQPVATIKPQWGDAVDVVVAADVEMLLWPGMALQAKVELAELKTPLAEGAEVGSLTLTLGEQSERVALRLSKRLDGPSLLWRLSRT